MKLSFLLLVVGLAGILVHVQGDPAQAAPEQTLYYASGELKARYEVQDGALEGRAERYWPDGTRQAAGSLRDGQETGQWTFWSRDGQVDLEKSGTYRAGERVAGPSGG